MAREAIPTWFFVLVIVRNGNRVLLVQERESNNEWYLPAGRVEPGETFAEAALRETLEESGVPVVLEHILRVEHTPIYNGTSRMRVVFVARPADDTSPRAHPNEHTLGARWFSADEMGGLPMRGDHVRRMVRALHDGAPLCPLSILSREGDC